MTSLEFPFISQNFFLLEIPSVMTGSSGKNSVKIISKILEVEMMSYFKLINKIKT